MTLVSSLVSFHFFNILLRLDGESFCEITGDFKHSRFYPEIISRWKENKEENEDEENEAKEEESQC